MPFFIALSSLLKFISPIIATTGVLVSVITAISEASVPQLISSVYPVLVGTILTLHVPIQL